MQTILALAKCTGLIFLIMFLAIGLALHFPDLGVGLAYGLIGMTGLAILRPFPRLYLGSRWFSLTLMLAVGFPTLNQARHQQSVATEVELLALKQTNAQQYLSRLAQVDPDLWLTELKTLDPAGYAQELARTEADAAKARAKAQAEFAALQARECGGRNEISAFVMSQGAVKGLLKAPSTASFPSWPEDYQVRRLDGCKFEVTSFVDAENSFGATLRTRYRAVMQLFPESGGWRTLDVQIES